MRRALAEPATPSCRLEAANFANVATGAALAVVRLVERSDDSEPRAAFLSGIAAPQSLVPWLVCVSAGLTMAFEGVQPGMGAAAAAALTALPHAAACCCLPGPWPQVLN